MRLDLHAVGKAKTPLANENEERVDLLAMRLPFGPSSRRNSNLGLRRAIIWNHCHTLQPRICIVAYLHKRTQLPVLPLLVFRTRGQVWSQSCALAVET